MALRLLLLCCGSLAGLLGLELLLRVFFPGSGFGAADQIPMHAHSGVLFVPDADCGYLARPNSPEYDEFACVRNSYPRRKTPARTRLLFLGDSVTHRARIINALRERVGEARYEFWNAGVESYNTRQEVAAYERYNQAIEPDHVILTFHNNDFFMTPVLRKEAGKMRIYTPRRQPQKINGWLFDHSYLYRFGLGLSLGETDRRERAQEVKQQLSRLQQLTGARQIRFSVVLLPVIAPESQWLEEERWSHAQALRLFQELRLTYHDLLPCYRASGELGQEQKDDRWHPNDPLARKFADELLRQGLLTVPASR